MPIPQLSKSQLHNPWEYHINEISKKILLLALVRSSVIMYFPPSEILLNSLVQLHLLITV